MVGIVAAEDLSSCENESLLSETLANLNSCRWERLRRQAQVHWGGKLSAVTILGRLDDFAEPVPRVGWGPDDWVKGKWAARHEA